MEYLHFETCGVPGRVGRRHVAFVVVEDQSPAPSAFVVLPEPRGKAVDELQPRRRFVLLPGLEVDCRSFSGFCVFGHWIENRTSVLCLQRLERGAKFCTTRYRCTRLNLHMCSMPPVLISIRVPLSNSMSRTNDCQGSWCKSQIPAHQWCNLHKQIQFTMANWSYCEETSHQQRVGCQTPALESVTSALESVEWF